MKQNGIRLTGRACTVTTYINMANNMKKRMIKFCIDLCCL